MGYLWAPPRYRWTDLLNSDVYDYLGSGSRADRIEVEDWLSTFLELCDFESGRLPGAAEREKLRQFRTVMARIVSAVMANDEPAKRDIDALNRYLKLGATHPELALVDGRIDVREAASSRGIDRVIGLVARTLADTLANGEAERIKECANPDCHWIMVDESRNQSRRWCEVTACGNLVKVREYRKRRARGRKTR